MKRRSFLKRIFGVAAGLGVAPSVVKAKICGTTPVKRAKDYISAVSKYHPRFLILYKEHVFGVRSFQINQSFWVKEIRLSKGDFTISHLLEQEQFDDITKREYILDALIYRMDVKFHRIQQYPLGTRRDGMIYVKAGEDIKIGGLCLLQLNK